MLTRKNFFFFLKFLVPFRKERIPEQPQPIGYSYRGIHVIWSKLGVRLLIVVVLLKCWFLINVLVPQWNLERMYKTKSFEE